ncbi:MAG: SHOCT domain-containing protein [Atopobiaceae bacterium]|nr:SHOCT domain-containing protein [Atopobiaceae bacterium]
MDAKEIADTLERHQSLLDSGALSQEEFNALKAKLLSDATAHDETSKEQDNPQKVDANAEVANAEVAKAEVASAEVASAEEELPPLEVVMFRVDKGDMSTTTAKIKDPLTNEEWKYPKNYSTKLSEHPKVGYHALANMIEQDTGRIVKRHSSWERDDRPVEVFFEWGKDRHLNARLRLPEASEEIRYGKHFVFPKNTNPKEFCQGVA